MGRRESRRVPIGATIAGTALAIFAAAAVALAVQGALAFQQRESQPEPPQEVTTTVRSEQLVDTVRAQARVVPQMTWAVESEGTVTRPGVRAGSSVGNGALLAVVDERPIVLLAGDVPMYRTLAPGAAGADVEQLQNSLADLGYYRYWPDGEYGDATAAAVYWFYVDQGFPPVNAAGAQVDRKDIGETSFPAAELTFAPGGSAVAASPCGEIAQKIAGELCTLEAGGQMIVLTPSEADATRIAVGQVATLQMGADALQGTVTGQYQHSASSRTEDTAGSGAEAEGEQEGAAPEFIVTVDAATTVAPGSAGTATIVIQQSPPEGLTVDSVAIREDPDGTTWVLDSEDQRSDVVLGLCLRGVCAVEGDGLRDGLRVVIPIPRSTANGGAG